MKNHTVYVDPEIGAFVNGRPINTHWLVVERDEDLKTVRRQSVAGLEAASQLASQWRSELAAQNMTPIEQMHQVLQAEWLASNPENCIAFKADMRDVVQWICYCTQHPPVTYNLYNVMQQHGVPLPSYGKDDVAKALSGLAQHKLFANVNTPE